MRLFPFFYAFLFLSAMFIASSQGVIAPPNQTAQTGALAAEASEKVFDTTKASVVRIGVKLTGNIQIPTFTIDPKTFELKPGKELVSQPVVTGYLGSGFVVNSDGYIVTNAHVVDVSKESVQESLWYQFASDLYDNLDATLPAEVDQTTLDTINNKLLTYVDTYGELSDITHKVAVFNPDQTDGTLETFIDQGFEVEIKKEGQPFPDLGKDIAVIKINKQNLSPVRLGNSARVKEGSKVFTIGYPVIADLNASGITKATLTSGIVSSIKKSSQGDYDVIQIDASISGGNSGGPALNDKGEVIGIATFGALESQGFNWILPINLAKTDLQELNVPFTGPKSGLANWLSSDSATTTIIAGVAFVIIVTLLIILISSLRKRKQITNQLPTAPLPPMPASPQATQATPQPPLAAMPVIPAAQTPSAPIAPAVAPQTPTQPAPLQPAPTFPQTTTVTTNAQS